MKHYIKTRVSARGGALSFADLPLFDWARDQILLANPGVRQVGARSTHQPDAGERLRRASRTGRSA